MRHIILAAVAAIALAGPAVAEEIRLTWTIEQFENYKFQHPNAKPRYGRWRLYRNSAVDPAIPQISVATFDFRSGDHYDANYNLSECLIIRGLVVDDNARRPMHLEFWCAPY